jgi:hypothetical protein
MEMLSSSGFAQWAYGIGRSRHGRHGKTDIRRGLSVQSGGIVLTMLLCSANDISAICSIPTKNITIRLARTYRCTRTRRSDVASRLSVARWRSQFWAGCITNISVRSFRQGHGERAARALKGAEGKRLMYRQPRQAPNFKQKAKRFLRWRKRHENT